MSYDNNYCAHIITQIKGNRQRSTEYRCVRCSKFFTASSIAEFLWKQHVGEGNTIKLAANKDG